MKEAVVTSVRRILATLIQTPGTWRTEVNRRGLIVSRGPLATPYFSPQTGSWLLFFAYEAYVLHIAVSTGWRGIEVVAAPGLILLLFGGAFERQFQLESITFDDEDSELTVKGIEGTARTAKRWPYRKLRRVSLVHIPARNRYQTTINQVVVYDLNDRVVASLQPATEYIFHEIGNHLPAYVVSTRVVV
jgi:hypothetical protein